MADILQMLLTLRDEPYKRFTSSLLPTVPPERIIGVRTPDLRKLAKQLRGSAAADTFLRQLPHRYYEENNLHAFLLEQIGEETVLISALTVFLPFVDNWATCDSLSPRLFKKQPPSLMRIDEWMQDEHVYTVRFGILCLMRYYLDERFAPCQLRSVAQIEREEYYIRMMQSWYFATALAAQWAHTLPLLEQNVLPLWVHNKTIQKAVESYRITKEQKQYLKTLKRR